CLTGVVAGSRSSHSMSPCSHRTTIAIPVSVALLSAAAAVAECPYDWKPGDGVPGITGFVYSVVSWDPDGPGPMSPVLVAGGYFSLAGDTPAANLAWWDGTNWHALGGGMNSAVTALAIHGGELIAGGFFTYAGGTRADRIAAWNGTNW